MTKKWNTVKKYIGILFICFIISSVLYTSNYNVYAGVVFTYHSTTDYNIKSDSGIKTTYSDNGYTTVLKIGSSTTKIVGGSGSLSGVNCTTTGTSISNGNYIKVNFHLENTTSSDVVINLASHADTQIGSMDKAPITALDGGRGFTMTDGTNMFTFIGKDSYGVTNIDTYWFGTYSDRESNMWNQVSSSGVTGIDSGMAFSWQNRTVPANGSIDLSVLFGVGDLNEPPTLTVTNSFKDKYFVGEKVDLSGKINDKDTGDTVTIKYAVDGGTEYTVEGTYTPNGTAKNYTTSFTIPSHVTEGNHTIQIWACDDKGNMSVPVTKTFYVELDKEAPTAEVEISPTDWTKGNVTIKVTATDSYSGMKQIKMPDGTFVSSDTATYNVTTNGSYIFVVEDNMGNKRNYTVTISNIDKEEPNGSATITQPTTDVRAAIINFTATDSLSGVAKIIKPDGTEVTGDSVSYSVTTPGTYTFKVVDKVGNEKSIDVDVTIISAGVTVKYIDQVTKKSIDTEIVLDGNIGEDYTTTAKDINGYILVATPSNFEGKFEMENKTVVYEYRKQSSVTAKYIDENYGNSLTAEIVTKYKEGDRYATEEKTFTGYELVGTTNNTTGTMARENIIVEYRYKKISQGVDVKYIDQVTKEDLVLPIVHQDGLEKDSYTAHEKTIEGYELVARPENEIVSMTVEKITLTYEYRKVSNITVKYIDENANTTIIDNIVTSAKEGDTYTTEEKTFTGYKITGKTTNTSGTMAREDIIIEYRYKKISQGVDVKYIDQVTNDDLVLPIVHQDGLEKDSYTAQEKDIPGYELVARPENETVSMTVEKITLIYEYRKVSNITVKYIDENTNTTIINNIVTSAKEGDTYTTEEKTFAGYKLTGKTTNTSGTMARENIFVEYRYKKISQGVDVKYIDQVTKEDLVLPIVHQDGLEKDSYTAHEKTIEGYELVARPENETVSMTVEKITLIYEYRKQSDVIVKYIDENYGTTIITDVVTTYKQGDTYTTEEKTFNGYKLTGKTTNTSGTMAREDITVEYRYKKISQGVDVKYIDQVTNDDLVLPIVHQDGLEKDSYMAQEKDIPGYELVARPENETVSMTVEKITLIYEYRKVSNITVKYIDENTNTTIIDNIVTSAKEGDTYTTEEKTFAGYRLTGKTTNTSGTMARENIIVEYRYKKISQGVDVKYIDQVTKEDLVLPIVHQDGLEKDSYTAHEKTIEGYELVARPENETVSMTVEKITLIYEYRKQSDVIVKYIDENYGTTIITDVVTTYKQGDTYTTEEKIFAGYRLTGKTTNTSGTMEREDITVEYRYKKISQGVDVRYINKVTGEDLVLPIVHQDGLEKDSYTAHEKTIEGYELVVRPENETVSMTVEKITLIYEYKKITSVKVKYIDMFTDEVLSEEEIPGLEEDKYRTEQKDIDGYIFIETEGILVGNMQAEPLEVIYKYKKLSNVIVQYIDANTNEKIIDDTVKEYKQGDSFEVSPKEIEKYALVESPQEESGVMARSDIIKVYKYKKISGGLTVKYVDRRNNEILAQEIYKGNERDNVALVEKVIDGYELDERPQDSEVELTVEPQERIFYYRRKITINVIGIDQERFLQLYKYQISGLEGKEYTTSAKEVADYSVVKIPDNASGVYKREDTTINYYYKRNSKGLVIKYIDIDTNGELYKKEITGLAGDIYETSSKEFKNYHLVKVEGEEEGVLTVEKKEVKYYYEKNSSSVNVIYQDEKGREIFRKELVGKIDSEYCVEEIHLRNYKVKEYPENMNGIFEEDAKEVIFIMEKIPSKIFVNLVLGAQNITIEHEGLAGDDFEFEIPEIDGFYVEGEKTIKAEYSEEGVLNLYVEYIKEEAPIEDIPKEENAQTGDNDIISLLGIFIVNMAIVIYILNKKENIHNN